MIKVYTDGSCRPNCKGGGKGGIGVVIESDRWNYTISEGCTQKCSNNMAEYLAVKRALDELLVNELESKEIFIHSDSEMLCEQLSGNRKVTGGSYTDVYKEVRDMLKKFRNVKFVWIPREENSEANLLASKAL